MSLPRGHNVTRVCADVAHSGGERPPLGQGRHPYMERTLRFRDDVVEKIPGVVHVDQTGRLQTVKKEWNERFHALLRAFYERTGVPILLNTSLNPMDKPIVHSVEDAVAVLYTSGLDALVLENIILEK